MHSSAMLIVHPGEDAEEIMAQYDENLEVEPRIVSTKKEFTEEAMMRVSRYLAEHDEFYNTPDKFFKSHGGYASAKDVQREHYEATQRYIDENYEEALKCQEMPLSDLYKEIRRKYYDDSEFDDEGNYIETYNEDGMWDWWVVGGRWPNMLRLKDGSNADEACASDLDIDNLGKMTDDDEAQHRRFWRFFVNGDATAALNDDEAKEFKSCWTCRKPADFITDYKDEEGYIKHCNHFTVATIVDTDSGWMVDDGFASEDEWEEYVQGKLSDLEPEDYVMIIDYHY